jgi:type I restriction enzyme M protein
VMRDDALREHFNHAMFHGFDFDSTMLRIGSMNMALTEAEEARNNLPDALARWQARDGAERERPRTARSFCVPKAEIAATGWDLSLNRYKEVVREETAHRPPKEILSELMRLEDEIRDGMKALEGMLG